jgi:hypothetical protein
VESGCKFLPPGDSMGPSRELLLKGKAQYSQPPNLDRLFCKKRKFSFSLKSS